MRRHSEAVQLPTTAAMGGGARDGRSRRGPVRVTATLGSVFVVRQEHGTAVSPVAWDRAGPGSAVAVADGCGLAGGGQAGGGFASGMGPPWGYLLGRAPLLGCRGFSGDRKGVPAGPSGASPCGSRGFWGRLCCPAGKIALGLASLREGRGCGGSAPAVSGGREGHGCWLGRGM